MGFLTSLAKVHSSPRMWSDVGGGVGKNMWFHLLHMLFVNFELMALFYFCSENGTSGESNQIPPLNADREVVRTHTPLFLYI